MIVSYILSQHFQPALWLPSEGGTEIPFIGEKDSEGSNPSVKNANPSFSYPTATSEDPGMPRNTASGIARRFRGLPPFPDRTRFAGFRSGWGRASAQRRPRPGKARILPRQRRDFCFVLFILQFSVFIIHFPDKFF